VIVLVVDVTNITLAKLEGKSPMAAKMRGFRPGWAPMGDDGRQPPRAGSDPRRPPRYIGRRGAEAILRSFK